jgi:hypothetical protein
VGASQRVPLPGGGYGVTMPRPGSAESASAVAQTGAKQISNMQEAYAEAGNMRSIYDNLEADQKKFNSGPMAKQIYEGTAAWNQMVPKGWQIGTEATGAYENFEKLAHQLALSQMHMGGAGGSDAQLLSNLAANPHAALSQYGLQRIMGVLKGNLDIQQHKFELWNEQKDKYGGAPGFGQFLIDNDKYFKPRAYQLQYLDKKHQLELHNEMDDGEKAATDVAYQFGKKKQWLKPPQASE